MRRVRGTGGAPGVALGRFRWQAAQTQHRNSAAQSPQQELSDFARAQQQVAQELQGLADACRREGRGEAAALLEVHALLLADEDFVAAVHAGIAAGADAAQAVQAAGEAMAAQLAALEDDYLQARAGDVRDVAGRLLDALAGRTADAVPEEPFILVAEDLLPSACIRLRDAPLLGIALQGGSPLGHTAILARGMGIPAVFGLGEAIGPDCDGQEALLDGGQGELLLDPDDAARAAFRAQQESAGNLAALRGLPDETRDGRRLDILCSIAAPQDCRAVLENDGRGVGLLRSEMFFLTCGTPPEEEQQLRAYGEVVRQMAGRRVVIRLMDMGADKQAALLPLPPEENPALGLRGVRLCLAQPQMLHTQLRAICRASAEGPVALLLPMVTSPEEVRACRDRLQEVQVELRREGFAFDAQMEVGVMIETPAAVLIAPELAQAADFFSIGTNDLAQYILACDRQAPSGRQMDAHHPAVFRAMRMAAEAAHGAGIRVGVCGEMGTDAALLPFLLEIGVDEVTVPPSAVLPLRGALREMDAKRACNP
ncbi:MAG: phosphoenolpyruvate--protein phosphotransferase [Clostridia bacterium]|nr:phosphoenolpyruvate--protein phosphotransferase [Clostridia bacterium]